MRKVRKSTAWLIAVALLVTALVPAVALAEAAPDVPNNEVPGATAEPAPTLEPLPSDPDDAEPAPTATQDVSTEPTQEPDETPEPSLEPSPSEEPTPEPESAVITSLEGPAEIPLYEYATITATVEGMEAGGRYLWQSRAESGGEWSPELGEEGDIGASQGSAITEEIAASGELTLPDVTPRVSTEYRVLVQNPDAPLVGEDGSTTVYVLASGSACVTKVWADPEEIALGQTSTIRASVVGIIMGGRYLWQTSEDGGETWTPALASSSAIGSNEGIAITAADVVASELVYDSATATETTLYRVLVQNNSRTAIGGTHTYASVTVGSVGISEITVMPAQIMVGESAHIAARTVGMEEGARYLWQASTDGQTWIPELVDPDVISEGEGQVVTQEDIDAGTLETVITPARTCQYRVLVQNPGMGIGGADDTISMTVFQNVAPIVANIEAAPNEIVAGNLVTMAAEVTDMIEGGRYLWQHSEDYGETWTPELAEAGTIAEDEGQEITAYEVTYNQITYGPVAPQVTTLYRVLVQNPESALSGADVNVAVGVESAPETIAPGEESTLTVSGTWPERYAEGMTASAEGTTVAAFLEALGAQVPEGRTLRVLNGDETLEEENVVGTGMVLELVNPETEEVADHAVIVVSGDVTGSGVMTLSQVVRMAQAVSGANPLEGAQLLAGDFGKTGTITLTDLTKEAALLTEGE